MKALRALGDDWRMEDLLPIIMEAFGCGVNEMPLSMALSWYDLQAILGRTNK